MAATSVTSDITRLRSVRASRATYITEISPAALQPNGIPHHGSSRLEQDDLNLGTYIGSDAGFAAMSEHSQPVASECSDNEIHHVLSFEAEVVGVGHRIIAGGRTSWTSELDSP